MKDDEIDFVLRLIKSACQQWPDPFMEKLAAESGHDPFKILVACILSLRTRDQATSEASERLFALSTDPMTMAKMHPKKLEKALFPIGFYRIKAKQIPELSKQICEQFQGKVPDDIDTLLRLPGVGRKTANLVRTVAFKKSGICVDVHVHRICNRLGYVSTNFPDDTESVLRGKLHKKHWLTLNKLLVTFGQNQCTPTSPHCSSCPLYGNCARVGVFSSR